MEMAAKYVNNPKNIINRGHEYSKGETIFVRLELNNFMTQEYGELLNVTVLMNVKEIAGGEISERIVSSVNAPPMLINDYENVTLAWNIHEDMKIGEYSITFDVFNTDTNQYIDTYGQVPEKKIGVSVISDIQIININRQVTTGIFDEVDIKLDVKNNMYVGSEILAQALFKAENNHMYWSDEFTKSCQSSMVCEISIKWDPSSQNYHNQSFNIGTFTGNVYIEDANSKFVTESPSDGGHPSYIRTPSIIDLDHFSMELLPELEVIFPNIDGRWMFKFNDESSWTIVGANYILSTFKDISSLQIQKLSNNSFSNMDPSVEIHYERYGDYWGILENEDKYSFIFNGNEISSNVDHAITLADLQGHYNDRTNFNFDDISNNEDNLIKIRYLTSTPTALRLSYSIQTHVSIGDGHIGNVTPIEPQWANAQSISYSTTLKGWTSNDVNITHIVDENNISKLSEGDIITIDDKNYIYSGYKTGNISHSENKFITDKFSSDGTQYLISHYALLDKSSISISTEPYYVITPNTFTGDMSAYGFTNTFDRNYGNLETIDNNLRILVRGATVSDIETDNQWNAFLGKGFSADISEKGYYRMQLSGSTVDHHKLVILSESYWDSKSMVGSRGTSAPGPMAIEIIDNDWYDNSKVKFSTEMYGNNPITVPLFPGSYYFMILTECQGNQETGVACVLDPIPVQQSLNSFNELKFQK